MRYVIFDLETTGLSKDKDHIIQFAAIKIENNKMIDSLNLYIQPSGNYSISPGAYLKHGISAKFLADKPYFGQVANQIVDFFETPETVAIVTYNGNNFDIPFLVNALQINGYETFTFMNYKCYDAFLEEKRRNGNSLIEVYKRYSGKTMEEAGLSAHDALSDVKATYSVFYAQQKNQSYAPETRFGDDNAIVLMDFKHEIVPCFSFGKYKGLSVEFVKAFDRGYLEWAVSDKSSFNSFTKRYIKQHLD